mgnify:CR=1 FL=1
MCQIDGISTGKLHDFQPGEGAGRPRPDTAKLRDAADWWTTWLEKPKHSSDHGWGDAIRAAADWIDAQPPASPAPPTPTPCPYIVTGGEGTSYCSLAEQTPTPQADRDKLEIDVEELLIDHCGMGGTSALTDRILALTDALTFAAAPPSTPADPRPTDPTGSEA